jgi:hypothetical protein
MFDVCALHYVYNKHIQMYTPIATQRLLLMLQYNDSCNNGKQKRYFLPVKCREVMIGKIYWTVLASFHFSFWSYRLLEWRWKIQSRVSLIWKALVEELTENCSDWGVLRIAFCLNTCHNSISESFHILHWRRIHQRFSNDSQVEIQRI